MSQGWIKLHRRIQDNPIWTAESFTRGQAWVDLLLLANHEKGYIYVRNHKVEIERGQVGWSQNRLAKRWKWSRTKVRKFLQDLEKEQQIKQEKSKSYTVITLIKYDQYQGEKQQEDNRKTTEKQQEDTNKNDKNVKNDKKSIATPPDFDEVKEYFRSKGYTNGLAEKFYNYYQEPMEDRNGRVWKDSNGNTVKSWKQKAIAVWMKDDNKKQPQMSYHQEI